MIFNNIHIFENIFKIGSKNIFLRKFNILQLNFCLTFGFTLTLKLKALN